MSFQNDKVVLAILHDFARPRKGIDDATRIYHDLLISGDDADEMLQRIHAACGTTFEGFDFNAYFPNETESLFARIALLFGWSDKKSITVGHLLKVVESGRWFEAGSN